MGLFKRRRAEVIKRGVGDTQLEEKKVKKVGGSTVEIRRVRTVDPPEKTKPKKSGGRSRRSRSSSRSSAPRRTEYIPPPPTDRKQMLVRRTPHQTQIVVLEGALLVEHFVARSDKQSLAGNIYLGRVRNVLPGMEAAFIDFGEAKNGVLYAGDVQSKNGKRGRIENVLKVGDEVVVQVVKDAMGHKGARLTNKINLSGRFIVLDPDMDRPTASRRLGDNERSRLKGLAGELLPQGFGGIVRTAAEGATREDLKGDIDRLMEAWDDIQESAKNGNAPRLIHDEPPLVIRVIREHFTREFRRLLVDDDGLYELIVEYLQSTDGDLLDKVSRYQDELPLFERFHVEDQLRKALDRKVWLPSGGHIVVDRTEALTVIDVNTGRFVGHSSLEETVLANNLEAAEEIAHQLRLRDIGGIIVIDFIDMENATNRETVLRKLREELAKDKTRTQVFEVSNLGLVEMTRKNVSEGLLESFSHICPECGGRGVVLFEDAATSGVRMPEVEVVEA
jgi:ribonuclease E